MFTLLNYLGVDPYITVSLLYIIFSLVLLYATGVLPAFWSNFEVVFIQSFRILVRYPVTCLRFTVAQIEALLNCTWVILTKGKLSFGLRFARFLIFALIVLGASSLC